MINTIKEKITEYYYKFGHEPNIVSLGFENISQLKEELSERKNYFLTIPINNGINEIFGLKIKIIKRKRYIRVYGKGKPMCLL
jgi:hypothetical protein